MLELPVNQLDGSEATEPKQPAAKLAGAPKPSYRTTPDEAALPNSTVDLPTVQDMRAEAGSSSTPAAAAIESVPIQERPAGRSAPRPAGRKRPQVLPRPAVPPTPSQPHLKLPPVPPSPPERKPAAQERQQEASERGESSESSDSESDASAQVKGPIIKIVPAGSAPAPAPIAERMPAPVSLPRPAPPVADSEPEKAARTVVMPPTAPRDDEAPPSWWRWCLAWPNLAFDYAASRLGQPGRALRHGRGRWILGWLGVALLGIALILLILDWIGWTP